MSTGTTGVQSSTGAVTTTIEQADSADRSTIASIAVGIALLGWWMRKASRGMKLFWVLLTLIVPLAIAWVVPPLWQLLLEGVLLGGVFSLGLWSLRSWSSLR